MSIEKIQEHLDESREKCFICWYKLRFSDQQDKFYQYYVYHQYWSQWGRPRHGNVVPEQHLNKLAPICQHGDTIFAGNLGYNNL